MASINNNNLIDPGYSQYSQALTQSLGTASPQDIQNAQAMMPTADIYSLNNYDNNIGDNTDYSATQGLSDPYDIPADTELHPTDGLKAPNGDNWPPGTTQTVGGYYLMPSDSSQGFTILSPDATGPDDQAHIVYYLPGNTDVKDKNGNVVFSFSADSDFKLPDGTLINIQTDQSTIKDAKADSKSNPEGGSRIANINVVNGNSHVKYAWNNARGHFGPSETDDGVRWLASHLSPTNKDRPKNYFQIGLNERGDVSFYQADPAGNILGKVKNSSWNIDIPEVKKVLASLVDKLHKHVDFNFDVSSALNKIKGDDIGPFMDDLNSALYQCKHKPNIDGGSLGDMVHLKGPEDFTKLVNEVSNRISGAWADDTEMANDLKTVLPDNNAIYGAYSLNIDPTDKDYVVAEGFKPSIDDPAYANQVFMQMMENVASSQSLPKNVTAGWTAFFNNARQYGFKADDQARDKGLPPLDALPPAPQQMYPTYGFMGGLGSDPSTVMNQMAYLQPGMQVYQNYSAMQQAPLIQSY